MFGKLVLLIGLVAILTGCAAPTATATVVPTLAPTAVPTLAPVSTSQTTPPEAATAVPVAGNTALFKVDAARSEASYTIDETFINQNNTLATAVGITTDINGELLLNYADPAASKLGEITVDISKLTSDSSRRDNAIRGRWLESSSYPIARFVATKLENFPANPQEGQSISFQLVGDMTVRDVTKTVTWEVTAMLNGNELTGTATTQIMLVDFGVEPPSIAGVLSVTDGALLTLNFTLVKQ